MVHRAGRAIRCTVEKVSSACVTVGSCAHRGARSPHPADCGRRTPASRKSGSILGAGAVGAGCRRILSARRRRGMGHDRDLHGLPGRRTCRARNPPLAGAWPRPALAGGGVRAGRGGGLCVGSRSTDRGVRGRHTVSVARCSCGGHRPVHRGAAPAPTLARHRCCHARPHRLGLRGDRRRAFPLVGSVLLRLPAVDLAGRPAARGRPDLSAGARRGAVPRAVASAVSLRAGGTVAVPLVLCRASGLSPHGHRYRSARPAVPAGTAAADRHPRGRYGSPGHTAGRPGLGRPARCLPRVGGDRPDTAAAFGDRHDLRISCGQSDGRHLVVEPHSDLLCRPARGGGRAGR